MDNLSESFGGLSTAAREWRPDKHSPQQKPTTPQQQENVHRDVSSDWYQESELNAAAVKEFIPGRGWSVETESNTSAVPTSHLQGTGSWAVRSELTIR